MFRFSRSYWRLEIGGWFVGIMWAYWVLAVVPIVSPSTSDVGTCFCVGPFRFGWER